MNKKIILIFAMFLISLISVYAAPDVGLPFRVGAENIGDFFRGGWQDYEDIILFMLLFVLFLTAFLTGIKKAFPETTRQLKIFAVVAALMSALSIVMTTEFSIESFSYIAWGLLGLLLVVLIHSILIKMGMEKHKFLAFILALIIAFILIFIVGKILSEDIDLDIGLGGRPSVTKKGFLGINMNRLNKLMYDIRYNVFRKVGSVPGEETQKTGGEGTTDTTTTPPGTTTTPPTTTAEGDGGKGGLRIIEGGGALILLAVVVLLIRHNKKVREGEKPETPAEQEQKVSKEIKVEFDHIINIANKLISIKEGIEHRIEKKVLFKNQIEKLNLKSFIGRAADLYQDKFKPKFASLQKIFDLLIRLNKVVIEKVDKETRLEQEEINAIKSVAQKIIKDEQSLKELERYGVKEFNIDAEHIIQAEEKEKEILDHLKPLIVRLYHLLNVEYKHIIKEEQDKYLNILEGLITNIPKNINEIVSLLEGFFGLVEKENGIGNELKELDEQIKRAKEAIEKLEREREKTEEKVSSGLEDAIKKDECVRKMSEISKIMEEKKDKINKIKELKPELYDGYDKKIREASRLITEREYDKANSLLDDVLDYLKKL